MCYGSTASRAPQGLQAKVTLPTDTTIFAESKSWQESAGAASFLKARLVILDVRVAATLTHPTQCTGLDLPPGVSHVFKDEASHPKTTGTGDASLTHTAVCFPGAAFRWPYFYTRRSSQAFWFQSQMPLPLSMAAVLPILNSH